MQLRDRIKELRRVPASQLRPNPKNWRIHPETQANTLRAVLAEIGIADAAIARELPDGTLMLIDGHLRAETIRETPVPVLVLDVTEAEADKLLLSLDPLSAMAEAHREILRALLAENPADNTDVQGMFDNLAQSAGVLQPQAEAPTEFKVVDENVPTEYCCPKCGYKWSGKPA